MQSLSFFKHSFASKKKNYPKTYDRFQRLISTLHLLFDRLGNDNFDFGAYGWLCQFFALFVSAFYFFDLTCFQLREIL